MTDRSPSPQAQVPSPQPSSPSPQPSSPSPQPSSPSPSPSPSPQPSPQLLVAPVTIVVTDANGNQSVIVGKTTVELQFDFIPSDNTPHDTLDTPT